jgi:hypothetical protein
MKNRVYNENYIGGIMNNLVESNTLSNNVLSGDRFELIGLIATVIYVHTHMANEMVFELEFEVGPENKKMRGLLNVPKGVYVTVMK